MKEFGVIVIFMNQKTLLGLYVNLRKKIELFPDSPQYIMTVWGVGYKFNEKKP